MPLLVECLAVRAADLRVHDLLELDDEGGVVLFGGRRILLYDAVALGLLRAQLVENFGLDVARGLLTRLGYTHGWRTAESLEKSIPWDELHEWRVAGGRLHCLQGLVRFEPSEKERDGNIVEGVWVDSYEAEQHILHLGRAEVTVCWSLVGFASGYLSRVHGRTIYAIEESCCGRGDSSCYMVARSEEEWGDIIEPHKRFYEKDCLDGTLRSLRASVRSLEKMVRSRRRALGTEDNDLEYDGIVARSTAMRAVLELGRRVAAVDTTILIHGESGVGKERVARYIHGESPRAGRPFLAINCGALPENLLESELFGHVKGAFSGAISDRQGLFEAAHGGTLLLDEIGDIPLALQVRLLRVLQERKVRRVGENSDRAIDVRVLAATHRDLAEEVATKRFREDLFYRLRVIELEIPPLRERLDDILPLARVKLFDTATRFKRKVTQISQEASELLLRHPWRGNVRELHNVIERAVVFAEEPVVRVEDLGLLPSQLNNGSASAKKGGTLAEVEKAHILETLKESAGNRTEAARRLGIGTATMYRKLKQYGKDHLS